jgi:hypothetical protein
MEITIGIGAGLIPPAYLARCNGTKVSLQTTHTETMIHVQFEPPPPVKLLLERLREEATEILPDISEHSREILWFILKTPDGWTTHQELIEHVWKEVVPKPRTVSKAIAVLNAALKSLNFGYAIRSRTGVYRLIPIAR